MKKLSVILPIYNGEKFIDKCLGSILTQKNVNLDDVEVLLINDGSKDASVILLKKYTKQYPNLFRFIDQKNKGAASTRNKGIALAGGEFTTLLDQDDWIDNDYFQTLLNAIDDNSTDVVQAGYKLVDSNQLTVQEVFPIKTHFGKLLAIPAWAKIYKTKFLQENSILFFENNIGEDSLFTLRVWLLARSYKSIDYAGYNNYFDNKTNVTNSLHKGLSEKVNIIMLLDEMLKVRSKDKNQQLLLEYNIIRTAMYYLLSYGKYATTIRFEAVYAELFDWLQTEIPGFKKNKYIWKKPSGEHRSASLGIKIIMVVHSLRAVKLFSKIYCRNSS